MGNFDFFTALDIDPKKHLPIPQRSCVVVRVPGEPASEAVKWALERHDIRYRDIAIPWLFQWLPSQSVTPKSLPETKTEVEKPQSCNIKNLSLPILMDDQGNYYHGTTEIYVWLFSRSFSGQIRLYTPTETLDFQQELEAYFVPAVKHVYASCLSSTEDSVMSPRAWVRPSPTPNWLEENRAQYNPIWKMFDEVTAGIVSFARWYHYRAYSTKTTKKALDAIETGFRNIEEQIHKTGVKGDALFGTSVTAPDLVIGAALAPLFSLLIENEASLASRNKEVYVRLTALKHTDAGKYVTRLIDSQKAISKASSNRVVVETKEDEIPFFLIHAGMLRARAINTTCHVLMVTLFPLAVAPMPIVLVIWIAFAALYYVFGYGGTKVNPELVKRTKNAISTVAQEGNWLQAKLDF